MPKDKGVLILAFVTIVAIVALVLMQKGSTGMLSLCPLGEISLLEPIPGGGQQIHCVSSAEQIGGHFGTYAAHPAGDYRRQTIATRGFSYLALQGSA